MHFTCAGAMTGQGKTSDGHLVLLMPWSDKEPHYFRGMEMSEGGAVLYGPSFEHVGRCHADNAFTIFLIEHQYAIDRLSTLLGRDPMIAAKSSLMLELMPETRRELENMALQLEEQARAQDAEAFSQEEVRASIEDRLLNLIAEGIQENSLAENPEMPRHDARTRMVMACWELSRQQEESNLTLNDLCVAAKASARVLQYAFLEMTGVTPNSFLRSHRLLRARRMLLYGRVSSVKEAAYSCGFTEMGRFSGRYRELFDCYPSETLAGRKT
jgi:AraC-like DNA-binding protein